VGKEALETGTFKKVQENEEFVAYRIKVSFPVARHRNLDSTVSVWALLPHDRPVQNMLAGQ
jgi:hypothetical protein